MEFTAQIIANLLHGEVEGDNSVVVNSISKIEEGRPGTLSFLANPKYINYIYTTNSSIVLVNKDFTPEKEIKPTLIRVNDAYQAFATLLDFVKPNDNHKSGIDPQSSIDSTVVMGEGVYVGAFTYIAENVIIGSNVKIHPQVYIGKNVEIKSNTVLAPGVKIYHDCKIGAECILHAGVVVGSDGFGFAPGSEKDYKKIPQLGNVIVEDNVEIGANTTIDRATIGSTIIRKGVKLDNLIQIAHNVEIGENTVICAQTGISGSTKIGKECMIGGQAGIVGHVVIADGVKIQAQAGVSSSVTEANLAIQGSPAFKITDHRKSLVVFKHLPELSKKIDELEKELKNLKIQLNN